MFHKNIVKISENLNTQNLLKNGFALNNDKRLQIYYLCKAQRKNDFLNDVEITVVFFNCKLNYVIQNVSSHSLTRAETVQMFRVI